MAYGMELTPENGVTRLTKSHNSEGAGKVVLEINGTPILGFPRGTLRELLVNLTETRQSISLLLEGGGTVVFSPNSAPEDWDRLKEAERA